MQWIRSYWLACWFLVASLLSLLGYQINGAYIGEEGMLVEAFVFIPLFWLCLFLALLAWLWVWLRKRLLT